MGFRRLGSVWFFSLLSAIVFVTLTGILSTEPTAPTGTPAVALAPVVTPASDSAFVQHATSLPTPPPLEKTWAVNADRRRVIVVPVSRASTLIATDTDFGLP